MLIKKMTKIAPSILSADLLDIAKEVKSVDKSGADYIHIDIMDGQYVKNITFGPNIVRSLRKTTKKILDVHLMINSVELYVEEFIKAGANIISFHPETVKNPKKIIELLKRNSCKAGIALHPKIKIKEIIQYLNLVDHVIVMGVIPGFGGQKFIKSELKKIHELNNLRKKNKLNFEIEVDGGINKETSKLCIKNGADVLVAGSYIFKAPKSQYKKLISSLR